MIKLISATALSVAFCTSCSACWFPFFPAYSAGYPGWGMPGPAYSMGYAPSYGCGYRAGYAPYAASYAPYAASYAGYGAFSGCSSCGQSCGGSCGTCNSSMNYLGGINLGCGTGNCGAINCIPDSNITNRPVPDTLDDAGRADRTYEGDRNDTDRDSSTWPDRRDRNGGVGSNLRDSEAERGDDFGRGGLRDTGAGAEEPDWRNRAGGERGMFGTGDDPPSTYNGGSRRPPIEDPNVGSDGGGAADVINRGANKPPVSDPLETESNETPDGEGDLLAPEPPAPTARRSNLFFASHRELRSSHSEAQTRQRLAGGRQGNSRTTKMSKNKSRNKAARWISLPMPVGQARL